MVIFKKKEKEKTIIKFERTKKIQNIILYAVSILVLLGLSLVSFLSTSVTNENYFLNAGVLIIVVILIILPLKRWTFPIKEHYSNNYIWVSIVIPILLINDYFNGTVDYGIEISYLGTSLSLFCTLVILHVDKKELSNSKKIIYSNIPHRRF